MSVLILSSADDLQPQPQQQPEQLDGDQMLAAIGILPAPPAKPSNGQASKIKQAIDLFESRSQPHDEDAEKAILGILLLHYERTAEIVSELRNHDFYFEHHRILFRRIATMACDREAPTFPMLHSRLKEAGEYDRVGFDFLCELVDKFSLPFDHYRYFIGILREMADRRRLLNASADLIKMAMGGADALELRGIISQVAQQDFGGDRELRDYTCSELDDGDFDVNYLIEDILPESQGGIVSGMFKTLKTTAGGVDLMMSLATGKPYLGRFDVAEAMPAGIISAESGPGTLKQSGRRVATAKDYERLKDVKNLFWCFDRPALPTELGQLERWIKRRKLKAVFIDPTYLVFSETGDKAANVMMMGGQLAPVTDLVNSTGCSIILCNHNRKTRGKDVGRFAPPELEEISMSGYAEWARFWLLLGARKEWDDNTASHWLWLRAGGSAGHSGLYTLDVTEGKGADRRWEVSLGSSSDARQQQKQESENRKAEQREQREAEHVRKLKKAVDMFPGGESARKLKEVSGLNTTNFGIALQVLLLERYAEPCVITKNKVEHEGYRPCPRLPGTGGTGGTEW